MTKKSKLQKILDVLNGADNKTLAGFKAFDEGAQKLKDEMLKSVRASTLDDVNSKIGEMKKSLSLDPLLKALSTLEENFYFALENMSSEMEKMSVEHSQKMEGMGKESKTRHSDMSSKMEEMHSRMSDMLSQKTKELADLRSEFNNQLSKSIEDVQGKVVEIIGRVDSTEGNLKTIVKDLGGKIDVVRSEGERTLALSKAELLSRLSNMPKGGNANRNIAIGGNTSVLSKYTDINLKAGTNVTITYTDNNTTKYKDVTIAATGGSGTVRTIESTTVSSTIGAVSGTDYVVIAGAGVKLDLPTAVSNTNLYTIKNKAASSVLVVATGAETIDGDANIILATQYTAVDLISDNANWHIT